MNNVQKSHENRHFPRWSEESVHDVLSLFRDKTVHDVLDPDNYQLAWKALADYFREHDQALFWTNLQARQEVAIEQALKIAREIGDRRGEAIGSWNLGTIYEQMDDLSRAIIAMQVRVDHEREIGYPEADKHTAAVETLRARLTEQ